jgi:hypothetical protein
LAEESAFRTSGVKLVRIAFAARVWHTYAVLKFVSLVVKRKDD